MDDFIKQLANEIRGKISEGTLCGKKVDLTDLYAMLVAVYEIGRGEELRSAIRRSETLRELEEVLDEKAGHRSKPSKG